MANPKSTQMWFGKAKQDLKTAKFLRPIESDFFSGIVFHAQQCTEKAIKGYLTHHNIRVLKTHDMEKLLASLSKINPELAGKYSSLKVFTKYAVEYRYPDVDLQLPPLTKEIVSDAVDIAEKVLMDLLKAVE